MTRVLVAGVGNVFCGDDGFGPEVMRRLANLPQRAGVERADFGTRGYDLALALTEPLEAAILVDAIRQGRAPGELSLTELEDAGDRSPELVNGHGLHPLLVLGLVGQMGGSPPPIYLVGCEPGLVSEEEGSMTLSAPVDASVDRAVEMVLELEERLLGAPQPTAAGRSTVA